MTTFLMLGGLIVLLASGLLIALRFLRRPDPAQVRLQRILAEAGIAEPDGESPEKRQRRSVLGPLLIASGEFVLQRLAPTHNLEKTELDIERAGRPFGGGIAEYLGLRLVLALGLALLGALAMRGRPIGTVLALLLVSAALGWWLPAFWLKSRIQAWQKAVWQDFPDTLDLLALCVGAGQGLDAAILRVTREWPGAMADQYARVLTEMGLGESRRTALLSMAKRIDIPEITSFISVIVQADRVGGSISNLMLEQADEIRTARRQRAEELARQAGTKMLFPLVFCMFPALMAVLLGPAIPQILDSLGNL